jgi:hypothetical protein
LRRARGLLIGIAPVTDADRNADRRLPTARENSNSVPI